jgi:crotonobetainyl-CoA:carnitine CoA-transferase CaiB-like acyl-CoA transferase
VPLSSLSEALQGVTVLDLSRHLAGPYCAMLLGDLGAVPITLPMRARGRFLRKGAIPIL